MASSESAGAKRNRAGIYVPQSAGCRSFIPTPLPPKNPLLDLGNPELLMRLSSADRAIGKLDAATELLPNPDLFVAMYVRKEAVLSSQIEGTQASLIDLLEYEIDSARAEKSSDVGEVVNYIRAMNHGLERLDELPPSIRLIKEIHGILLQRVRGSEREPGEFRRTQNWIGAPGCSPSDATFVPPPPQEVLRHMSALEEYIHMEDDVPPLIKIGLIHSQFETVHPFLDGNGRMGRLLITFLLCWKKILSRPLLYISYYFKENRMEYYERLQRVRDYGEWEEWIIFFLKGVRETSVQATDTAKNIQRMREDHRALLSDQTRSSASSVLLLDKLFEHPFVSVKTIAEIIGRSYPAANALVSQLEELGLLHEVTGQKRNRVYIYKPYLDLLNV